jgi:predicted ATPase
MVKLETFKGFFMRIDKLKITSPWKNLEGFTIDFDETCDVTVLIGRNGSAKSNLTEAIIHIIRNLDLNTESLFSYEFDYQMGENKVSISGIAGTKGAKAKVNGKVTSKDEIREKWLPKYLVGYYSGESDRFRELFYEYDNQALQQTLTDQPKATLKLRSRICARPVHGLFALLAFYFSDDTEVTEFLGSLPRIEAFDSVLIELRKPSWAKPKSKAIDFWGARGPVREVLEALRRHSLAPFIRTVTEQKDFRHRESIEMMYLYLPDLKALHAVAKEYGNDPRIFFQAIDTMRLSEFIDETRNSFRVKVRVKGASGAIGSRQLSEGEQQLLTVLGLMRFTRDESSLYLLDEPDTHLNPAWGVEYLDRLRKIGGIDKNSHTIIATHDPLLVAGLRKEEIRVLYRATSGKIVAEMPKESPRGTGVANVLTSPLFGLESQLDAFSLRVLKRIYEVSLDDQAPNRQRHLERLRKLVPALAPLDSSPDPYRNIAKTAYELALEAV